MFRLMGSGRVVTDVGFVFVRKVNSKENDGFSQAAQITTQPFEFFHKPVAHTLPTPVLIYVYVT